MKLSSGPGDSRTEGTTKLGTNLRTLRPTGNAPGDTTTYSEKARQNPPASTSLTKLFLELESLEFLGGQVC